MRKTWYVAGTAAVMILAAAMTTFSEQNTGQNTEQTENVSSREGEEILAQAAALAQGYDYDAAISLLQGLPGLQTNQAGLAAIEEYEQAKAGLVRIDPADVENIYFRSLIIDTAKAFDGDNNAAGYNQVLTTKSEFLKMMQSMYDRGYVLVRLHDLAYETVDENGNPKFVYGDIMLPEGKKAFVLSQGDVCYYEYMEGDGFARRMVIGENGYPECEFVLEDGSIDVGEYDLVPILERFIQEHPGFSYRGARGVLAFTGYNGILGYRTDGVYQENPTYEAEREQAAEVAQCLREHGWELASHSWGHRNLGMLAMNKFTDDLDRWEDYVGSLIGPTDILILPYGGDIGDSDPYDEANERYAYLKSKGYRYFCNIRGGNQPWSQLGPDYFRLSRRSLDGSGMYNHPELLSHLFNVSEVFDTARPTPIPESSR